MNNKDSKNKNDMGIEKRKTSKWKISKSQGDPKYKTAGQLQKKISAYFNGGMRVKTVIVGNGANKMAVDIPVPTISGLCHFLGFASRQSFYDMEERPELSYTIKRARLLIEQDYEEDLKAGLGAGAIFALKNFGWKDEHSVAQSGEIVHKHIVGHVEIEDRVNQLARARACMSEN